MITLPFTTVDVFTDKPFLGNPLAIVEQAEGLSTKQMQLIAREFNLSETIFVQEPEDPKNSAKVRIFFPTAEIPFAGHPTIGCAIHLAQKQSPNDRDFETHIILEEQAGLVPVKVKRRSGVTRAQFVAPIIPHRHEGEIPGRKLAAQALALETEDIGFGDHTIGIFSGGPAFLYVPVQSLEALAVTSVREPYWSQMIGAANVDSAYIYTAGNGKFDYQARMYSPTAGIPEDPATGSASAILAAQLLEAGELKQGQNHLNLMQGKEMGRQSHIGLEVDIVRETIHEVRISGTSVLMGQGELIVPDKS